MFVLILFYPLPPSSRFWVPFSGNRNGSHFWGCGEVIFNGEKTEATWINGISVLQPKLISDNPVCPGGQKEREKCPSSYRKRERKMSSRLGKGGRCIGCRNSISSAPVGVSIPEKEAGSQGNGCVYTSGKSTQALNRGFHLLQSFLCPTKQALESHRNSRTALVSIWMVAWWPRGSSCSTHHISSWIFVQPKEKWRSSPNAAFLGRVLSQI